jgi:hypothetical protein
MRCPCHAQSPRCRFAGLLHKKQSDNPTRVTNELTGRVIRTYLGPIKGNAENTSRVTTRKVRHQSTRIAVPDLDCQIIAPTNDEVFTEGNTSYEIVVTTGVSSCLGNSRRNSTAECAEDRGRRGGANRLSRAPAMIMRCLLCDVKQAEMLV